MKKRVACAVIALLALCLGAALAETQTVTITGVFGQTEARSMLRLINDFRTGSDAWYWNEDDTEKVTCEDMSPLEYSDALEKIAMQRAVEIALSFSHIRPNGQDCFSLSEDGVGSSGENIAAGYDTVGAAFTAWQEADARYAGQGHRRNMLDAGFRSVGIGHVVFNGTHFWTQEFSVGTASGDLSGATDDARETEVEIDLDRVVNVSFVGGASEIELMYGERATLPTGIRVKLIDSHFAFPLDVPMQWRAMDDSIAKVEGSALTGVRVGQTVVSATVLGVAMTVPVQVIPKDLSEADVTVKGEDIVYTGAELRPEVSVKLEGEALKADADYTVSYADNVNAGTATVTVDGTGNYKGTVRSRFTIARADIASATVAPIVNGRYTGQSQRPVPEVSLAGKALRAGVDFTVAYQNNVNAGTATAIIDGAINYTGTLVTTFAIDPADIGDCMIGAIPAQLCTGIAIEPPLSITYLGVPLTLGVDFIAAYRDNVDVGVAIITVMGGGNYVGVREAAFVISATGIDTCDIKAIPAQYFTGKPVKPAVQVTFGGVALELDKDYTVAYSNNVRVGTATATITGMGRYDGVVKRNFDITDTGKTSSGFYRIASDGTTTYLKPSRASKTATIPDTVTLGGRTMKVVAVADQAFYDNDKLSTLTIGKNVKIIGKSAFENCVKLKKVSGGSGLTEIRKNAFKGCKALTAITLAKNVKSVGASAFSGCKALKTITVKTASLTASSVGSKAFKGIAANAVFKCPKDQVEAYGKLFKSKGAPGTATYQ